ncbi:Molecular chaperone [Nitrincola lacisaponensis]|uniref:Molecular chaperone n=1 Tax=Nitrincola lacisaponensis TaxID=267850 RepID=A0A063Y756_9GAMM|nr:flagellar hook-length control protein FliK [Nitrincola lacisaponensis]KDE40591.1 Molecular chaperone [Nitrincola lacisaponensis]
MSATPTSAPAQAPAQAPTSVSLPATAAVSSTTAPAASPTPSATQAFANTDAGARPQGFPVRVLVAGQVLDLVSPRPVQAGQQVDVTRTEQGMIRIQFLPTATPIAQQPAVQAVMQQALREVLPVQLPLADGLNQLMQISERPGARQHSALNQLIHSMLSLFSVKPGAADADKAIARNLQQGGLLSEAGLSRASSQQPPAPDLKQQLGQLLRLADTLPAQAREQLNQLVNALLARSTAQQISSLQRWRDLPDGGQERHYRLDLPIQQQQGFDNAELRITEHRRRNEQGEFVTVWSVRLHFELDSEGAVDAELSLQERYQLQASFWVEKVSTLERLRERLQPFEAELKAKGFDVAPLNARLGKLANPEITPLSKRLVDVHT